jgi:hypothetical protein
VTGVRFGDEIKRFFDDDLGSLDRRFFAFENSKCWKRNKLPEQILSAASVHGGSDDDDRGLAFECGDMSPLWIRATCRPASESVDMTMHSSFPGVRRKSFLPVVLVFKLAAVFSILVADT